METENWNNDVFDAAPLDTEYDFTFNKEEVGFIMGVIDSYIQLAFLQADKIGSNQDTLEQFLHELDLILSIGGTLTTGVGIEYKTDVLQELKEELEKVKSELLEK